MIGETKGHLGCSLYLRDIIGRKSTELGAPPPVDLEQEKAHAHFVRSMISAGLLTTVHDVSDGGLLIAVTEMAMSGKVGVSLQTPDIDQPHGYWFGEDQGRYVVAIDADKASELIEKAEQSGIFLQEIGKTGGDELTLDTKIRISIEELAQTHESWFPNYMSA